MTDAEARTVANAVLTTAGAAATYVVLTRPPLRRFVFRAIRLWLGASVPVYLANEARQAWLDSARPRPDIMAR